MAQIKTLGGDRLGAGKKMTVELHNYERSTHDLSYLWRSTMSAGTLVPFMKLLALPGDTFDIKLNLDTKTHPTVGPLFASFKAQCDIFVAPLRLYQGQLHNNKLGIGMKMANVKLPTIPLSAGHYTSDPKKIDNSQINPSCLLAYLGIRGVGQTGVLTTRYFNAVPILAYWDIYKNYYSNKQEELGAVIHQGFPTGNQTITAATVFSLSGATQSLPQAPTLSVVPIDYHYQLQFGYTGTPPSPDNIIIHLQNGAQFSLRQCCENILDTGTSLIGDWKFVNEILTNWGYGQSTNTPTLAPNVTMFPLEEIDAMREYLLSQSLNSGAVNIQAANLRPYKWLSEAVGTFQNMANTQEGLGIKTYQSDLFNNWLSTEWIDGTGGITAITAIDTSGGSFTLDTLNLSKKVYDMLNRIAVSGGTYDDWLDAVYTHERYTRCESPMYMGGLIKELVFQEVVSNSDANGQPLGTLAGKGTMSNKHKGGYIHIKIDEPSYIIGIVSLTPRIDYSQGNDFDMTQIQTMDDLHKPALDQIGFQEVITEQLAWWDTSWDAANSKWVTRSAGKQPAWMNYMTSVNKTYGNFAIQDNEMFMTLNRRYEAKDVGGGLFQIKDLTTYIDPVKCNYIFAETSLDAMNFWTQISCDIEARRKMSAKLMPNL